MTERGSCGTGMAFGGHVKKCVVSFTCEVSLSVFGKKVEQAYDETTRLNLLA